MITSAQAEVTPSENDATLYFDVMPDDYFIIRAYLVDPSSNAPLSEELTSEYYTKEQQEFYALTPEDFPEELIWQEDKNSSNFVVFDENATIVRYTEGYNIFTKNADTGTITIENADDTVKSLSTGNALILFSEEDAPVLLKVDTIAVEGNTVTITEKEAALEDFFEIIRIHSGWVEPDFSEVEFGDGVTVTQNTPAQNLSPQNMMTKSGASANAADDSGSTEFEFHLEHGTATGSATYTYELGEIELDKFEGKLSNLPKTPTVTGKSTVSGEIGFTLSASINCDWNKKNKKLTFGMDLSNEINPSFEVNGSLGFDFSLLPKLSKKPKIDLGYGFHAYIDPKVHIEAEGSTKLDTSFTQQIGFSYDSSKPDNKKFVPLKETTTGEVNEKIEGSFFIGFNLHPGIEWISDNLFDFSATEFGAGVLITGTLLDAKQDFKMEDEVFDDKKAVFSTELSNKKERHLCQVCIDGEVQAKFSIEIHLRILACLGDDTDVYPYFEVELPKIHIGYFYISLADEMGNLQFKFGKGKCPNRAFLFHMDCVDSDTRKKISKADMTVTDSNSTSASAPLPTDVWLKPGTYQVTASAENYITSEPRTYTVKYLSVPKEQDFNMDLTKKTDSDGKVKYSLSIGGDMNLNDVEYISTLNGSTEKDTLTTSLESQKYSLLVTVKDNEGNEIPATVICSYSESAAVHDVLDTLSFGRSLTETIYRTAMKGAINYELGNYQKLSTKISPSRMQYTLPKGIHTFAVTSPGYETGKFYVTMPNSDHEELFILQKKEEPTEATTEEIPEETIETIPPVTEPTEATTEVNTGNIIDSDSKNGFTWSLDSEGLLNTSGKMPNYPDKNSAPWMTHKDDIKAVVMKDNTNIGNGAFYGCVNLTSVTIPDGVTRIGACAFYGCDNLTSVTIPDSITNIEYYAFFSCDSLREISIPDRVTNTCN